MLLRDVRKMFRTELTPLYGQEESDRIFYLLLEHYLGLPRFVLGLDPRKNLSKEEEAPLLKALSRLKAQEPVQYIMQKAFFMDMELDVGPGVLIPRPETEELVRWILEDFPFRERSIRVLDVGTGSGCVAIALAKALPDAEVCGLDLSVQALEIAARNAGKQDVKLSLEQMDLFDASFPADSFDLIVSNPPYIPLSEARTMAPHVRDQEPHEALFVPNDHPLIYYRQLIRLAAQCLTSGGWLYVETHSRYGEEVRSLFESSGYVQIQLKKDIFGRDRYVRGRFTKPVGEVSK
jgi:release factor glutamine methyltransferase